MSAIQIARDTFWVGVKDPDLPVFDIIMKTESGTTYNAYLVKGTEKTVLIETVKANFAEEYFANLAEQVDVARVDYLVVNHTEPDHSGAIVKLLEKNPNIEIICSAACIPFINNVINREAKITGVKDNFEIDLGDKKMVFKTMPYMHWPDTMMEFVPETGVLFSCDGFAAHISADTIYADELPADKLEHEVDYYYDVIMRPFAFFIGKNLKKLEEFDIKMIAPSHGPIFRQDPGRQIEHYAKWSADKSEGKKQATILYASAYGNTGKVAQAIAAELKPHGWDTVLLDVAEMDPDKARDEIEAAKLILFGTPTFNGDAVKPVWDAVNLLSTVHSQGKKAAVFGSYGWSGEGPKLVAERLAGLRVKVFEENYRARLVPSEEDLAEVKRFTAKLLDFVG
ncbi:MAG TPA: FprA family A-type flavoprotein [candidate division Zixibacteria bacterium]|nr:FprA family A-type flavoprotein [candidate division Zixibacteria bacterium]